MGHIKLMAQIHIPANAIPAIEPENAPITRTAYELRTAASEKAMEGVNVTNI